MYTYLNHNLLKSGEIMGDNLLFAPLSSSWDFFLQQYII